MNYPGLAANLDRVRNEIARLQSVEGLKQDVLIVAVTKGHPAAAVKAALDAGLDQVGENRVQEALQKRGEVAGLPVEWHLIGHLQTNKARLVPGAFARVHSVDSWRIAEALADAAEGAGTGVLRVLLQVNVAGEGQKSGCAPDAAPDLAHRIAGDSRLKLDGLMTMAPLTDDERVQRVTFGELRKMRESIARSGLQLSDLSMGMSGDFRAAVAEGATILRLGTILFGERQ
jgi:hypothetical protein